MIQGGREVAFFLFVALVAGFALTAPAAAVEGWPTVAITHPDGGATVSGTVTVTGTASDPDGMITKVLVGIDDGDRTLATDTSGNDTWWTWEWVWDTTHWPNGWHRIVAIAWDDAGQAADTAVEVLVENHDEPPVVEIHTPEENAVVSGIVNITGHARDDNEVLFVKIRIDPDGPVYTAEDTSGNGSWWTWKLAWDSRDVPNGEHVVYAKVVDNLEQVGWDSVHIKVVNEGANTPPWVEIITPKSGAKVSGIVAIWGHAGDHDPDDKVELVQVRIDDGEWQNATDMSDLGNWAVWKFLWDTTHAEVGWHHVSARSWDGEDYSKIHVIEVYVVREGEDRRPEVRIDGPHDGDEVAGAVLVHGRAWDPDPDDRVTGVWARIDHGEWHLAKDITDNDTWFIWGWVWDTTKYENGWHLVCAKSYDGELYSELACIEVKVSNPDSPPGVEIEAPVDGQTVHKVTLVWGFAWDDREVVKVQVRIDQGEWVNAVDTSSDHTWRTWAWEWDTTKYENGEHVVSARSWDGHAYSETDHVVVFVENPHEGGIIGFAKEQPVLTGGLVFTTIAGMSLFAWWRRFGPLGSLR